MVSQPRLAAALATARITAFSPGQSPPPVTMPIRSFMVLLALIHSSSKFGLRRPNDARY